jgi:hypothetical protein
MLNAQIAKGWKEPIRTRLADAIAVKHEIGSNNYFSANIPKDWIGGKWVTRNHLLNKASHYSANAH